MSNDWRRKISRLLVGGVLLSGASLALAAQWVVVTAERTAYKSGALLDDKTPIKLAEGAQLTLLAEDGKTLKLTGPYAGVPATSGDKGTQTNNLTAIASLLQGHRQSTSTLGVMRSFGADGASPDPIEVDKSGEHSLMSDPVVLLRDNIAKTEEVALIDGQGPPLPPSPGPPVRPSCRSRPAISRTASAIGCNGETGPSACWYTRRRQRPPIRRHWWPGWSNRAARHKP